ncbi:MAG: zinc ribbon domain-containing protein [Nitrospiraceae bacterium]|nr:zinc ribbon domain-containing protein [Nitrospiraceae bacterium]
MDENIEGYEYECAGCGTPVKPDEPKCPKCGETLEGLISIPSDTPASLAGINEEDFVTFVEENANKYLQKFRKIEAGEKPWLWPAFLFGPWWLAHRKLYLWALLALLLERIPFVNIGAHICWGIYGNTLYYKRCKKKILKIRAKYPASEISSQLTKKGGVSIVMPLLFVIATIGVIAAVVFGHFFGK